MRLIERDQLRLASGANQLLARERRVADESLEGAFDSGPQIDNVGGEIFRRTRLIEVSQDGARAIQ